MAKYSSEFVVGGGGEIVAGSGWSWVVGVKLWLAVGGADEIRLVVGGCV